MSKDNNDDSFWDNPFGGMFDFDNDGNEDLGEQWIAYNIFEDIMKDDGPSTSSDLDSDWDSGRSHSRHSSRSAARPSDKGTGRSASHTAAGEEAKTPSSPTEYAEFCREALTDIIKDALIWLLVCALIIAAIMWPIIDTYHVDNTGPYFTFAVFTIFLLFIFTKPFVSKRIPKWKQYRDTEQNYMASLGEEEKQAIKHKRTIIKAAAVTAICIIVFSAYAFFGVRHAMLVSAYEDAQAFIDAGQYGAAMLLLEDIEDKEYKDTLAFQKLCETHAEYDKGNLSDAHYALDKAEKADFRYQSEESLERIRSFRKKLDEEYEQYTKKKYQKEREAYSKRLANGVPYVGMSESDIGKTSLGSPSSKVRHNYQVKDGNQYMADIYDFYNGRNVIFSARCVQGMVTEVWDWRDDPIEPYVPDKKITYHSEPSVDEFSNPEDFYDFYYDDFADYYDAEDYYNEHGGR